MQMDRVLTHELNGDEFICHKMGIIEPITNSIFVYLSREGIGASGFIDEALKVNSVPLMARIEIALRHLMGCDDSELSDFVERMLVEKVCPALPSCRSLDE